MGEGASNQRLGGQISNNSLMCLKGKSMPTGWGKHYYLPFLPRLGPLKGFWADMTPFNGPQPRLVYCFRNYRGTRTPSIVGLSEEVPWYRQEQLTRTLLVHWLKTNLFSKLGGGGASCPASRIELVARPEMWQPAIWRAKGRSRVEERVVLGLDPDGRVRRRENARLLRPHRGPPESSAANNHGSSQHTNRNQSFPFLSRSDNS